METTSISSPIITNALLKGLNTAFIASEGDSGWLNGILFSLENMTFETASKTPVPGRPNIIAHVHHVRLCLETVRAWARGEQPQPDWGSSWHRTSSMTKSEWEDLKLGLQKEFELTQELIQTETSWNELSLSSAIDNIAHCAYHASAIRQIIKLA
jgi:hypothetical protein